MVTLVSQQRIVGDPNFENTKSDSNFASEAIHFVGAVGQKFSTCYLRCASPHAMAQEAKRPYSLPVKDWSIKVIGKLSQILCGQVGKTFKWGLFTKGFQVLLLYFCSMQDPQNWWHKDIWYKKPKEGITSLHGLPCAKRPSWTIWQDPSPGRLLPQNPR